MGKKQEFKEIKVVSSKVIEKNFLDLHWDKIMIFLLFLLPFLYFAQFLSPDTMIAGSDYVSERYALEKWTASQKTFPLWYPHIYGGLPVFASPIGMPLAPLTWLIYIIPPQVVLVLKFLVFFFLGGLGVFLYLKEIGLSKYATAIGAFTYQFMGNLATTPYAGHAGRAASVAIFPIILYFLHHALRTKKFSYFIILGLTIALAFYEGQFQINYYGLLFILAYLVYYLIAFRKDSTARDRVKIILYGLGTIVLFSLLMAVVWLPVLSGLGTVSRGIERGYEYSTSWAMPPLELVDLIVPSFSGILDNYWGSNPFKLHTEYFGLLTVLFALFVIIRFWKKPYIRFYAIAFVVVTLTAIGAATPFFRILYSLVPGFKLFRAPSLVFYLGSFSFIVLAAMGFDYVVVQKMLGVKKFFVTSFIALTILLLILLIAVASGRDLAGSKASIYENNSGQLTQGIILALLLFAAVLGTTWLGIKKKLNITVAAAIFIILTLISQVPLMARFLPRMPKPETAFAVDGAIQFLKNDPGVFRVLPLNYENHGRDNYLFYHGIQNAGGATPNPIQRYQEYIGAGTSVMFNPNNLIQFPKLLDILNVKYIVAPTMPDDLSRLPIDRQRYAAALKEYLSRFQLVFQGYDYSVYKNDRALPRAYIVPDFLIVTDNKGLQVLKTGSFDPEQAVVLEKNPVIQHPSVKLPIAEVKIAEYSADKVACETDCPNPGFLVLADNWHPDWQAFVDGQKTKLYRANYTFRAVELSAGKHTVIFVYKSFYFSLGIVITLTAMIIVIAIFLPRLLWWIVIKTGHYLKK